MTRESKNNVHILLNQMFNSDSTMVSTEGKNSMLVTKELVEKMTGEYNLRNKHEVKLKVQLQFLRCGVSSTVWP